MCGWRGGGTDNVIQSCVFGFKNFLKTEYVCVGEWHLKAPMIDKVKLKKAPKSCLFYKVMTGFDSDV